MKLLYLFCALLLSMNLYGQGTVHIGGVENKIILGPLAQNRDLAFGVKNILEETIQEKGFDLDEASPRSIKVEELRKKKLFVATPMYGGMAHGMFVKSCLDLQTLCSN